MNGFLEEIKIIDHTNYPYTSKLDYFQIDKDGTQIFGKQNKNNKNMLKFTYNFDENTLNNLNSSLTMDINFVEIVYF